jgi:hypothetical protein
VEARYLQPDVLEDLRRKMVFLSGPRQVGRTWTARQVAQVANAACPSLARRGEHLLWDDDDDEDRRRLLTKGWPRELAVVVFDEVHKFPRWKTWIKGIWDKREPGQSYLLTGSARMDVFKRGGDSLLGRYHHWRLHPFCLREKPLGLSFPECFERLLHLGGFPEPFLSGSERAAKRWRKERSDLLIREDLRDLD